MPCFTSKSTVGLLFLLGALTILDCSFTDEEVLQEDFKDELARIADIVRPFVHWSVKDLHNEYESISDGISVVSTI